MALINAQYFLTRWHVIFLRRFSPTFNVGRGGHTLGACPSSYPATHRHQKPNFWPKIFGRAPKLATYISTCTCPPVICHQVSKLRRIQKKPKCLTGLFLTSLPSPRQPTGRRCWRFWRLGACLSARLPIPTWAPPSKSTLVKCYQRCIGSSLR